MTLRWVIAGGGTGGHVTPALALGEVLRRQGEPVRFIGTRRGIEGRLVPEAGFELVTLDSRPFIGRRPLDRLRAVWALAAATWRARGLLREFRANVVISVGGYASAPPALAAVLSGIPMALVNTDAVPGAANRLLLRFARRVFVGFPSAAQALRRGPGDPRIVVSGVPLREDLCRAFERAAAGAPAAPDHRLHLFLFGGSQGARQINDAMLAILPELDRDALAVVHQTGEGDRERVARAYSEAGFDAEVVAFERNMPGRYRWADLVVCRAGAISVAELALAGRPALLLPLAHVGGGEQFANARELEQVGAARVLDSRQLTPEAFREALQDLLGDAESLRAMGKAAATLARPDAAQEVIRSCRALVQEGRQ